MDDLLQLLADERDIARLISAYGPLVDSGRSSEVADLWTEDGVYDVDGYYMAGREQIRAMVESEAHQGLIARGCAHIQGVPHINVTGDTAVAVCHSTLVLRHDERFHIARAGANRFDLARTPDGWRIRRRTTRVLDGSATPLELLASIADPM